MFASGADLQSINPLLTVHPLARQAQRYLLFTTLVRYDSALAIQPYLARQYEWSLDHRDLTFHLLTTLRWHDGFPTTARDVSYTLGAALDPATGYPRRSDLAGLDSGYVHLRETETPSEFRLGPAALVPGLDQLAA